MITQTRIIEWYQHYGGNVCVSFSGGKDSTVLLHIARQIYPDIPAVFSNTGLEYPEIQRFAKSFDNVDVVRPDMRFDQVVSTYGYPLIGKEVAEAIYYARRIHSQNVNVERESSQPEPYRNERCGEQTDSPDGQDAARQSGYETGRKKRDELLKQRNDKNSGGGTNRESDYKRIELQGVRMPQLTRAKEREIRAGVVQSEKNNQNYLANVMTGKATNRESGTAGNLTDSETPPG